MRNFSNPPQRNETAPIVVGPAVAKETSRAELQSRNRKLAGASFVVSALFSLVTVASKVFSHAVPSEGYADRFTSGNATTTCPQNTNDTFTADACAQAEALCANASTALVNGSVAFIQNGTALVADCLKTEAVRGTDLGASLLFGATAVVLAGLGVAILCRNKSVVEAAAAPRSPSLSNRRYSIVVNNGDYSDRLLSVPQTPTNSYGAISPREPQQ
jgi:hypothetical protein